MVSYSLDIVVTKHIAYNEKFVHLQIGLCKCQYLGTLDPNRQWTHPLVTHWLSNISYFLAYQGNHWIKYYLPDGLILPVFLLWALTLQCVNIFFDYNFFLSYQRTVVSTQFPYFIICVFVFFLIFIYLFFFNGWYNGRILLGILFSHSLKGLHLNEFNSIQLYITDR